MQQKTSTLVLILGDFFIPTRATGMPDKLKELFIIKGSIKVHHVLCIGNVGSKETTEWLKDIGEEFTMVRGDEDAFGEYPEHKVLNIGKLKIGAIHGHQVVPWGDEEALLNYAREIDCDILAYGHIHQPKVSSLSGKYFINPGSATGAYSSLSMDNHPSFALLEIQDDTVNAYIYEYKGGKVQISKANLKDVGEQSI